MKKLLGFVIRLALFVALAVWLADRPGTAHIVWHNYEIDTSAAMLGIAALVLGFVFYLLFRLWHLVRHGPAIWRLSRKLKKLQQGQECLTQGTSAVAAGDASEAGRYAVGARKLLGPTTATQLLQAQAAQLAADHNAARTIYRALSENAESAILGYRGLIMEARREGNWDEVEALADRLHGIKPETPWISLIRFESAVRRQQWDAANAALTQISATRLLEPEPMQRYRAALLIALAQNEMRLGKHDKALQAAEQAARQAPNWLPAIIGLAQSQMTAGHPRAAQRTVEKSWVRMPHPQLAAIYVTGADDAVDIYKRTERLCRDNEDAPASRLVLAEAALNASIWGEARRHLNALVSQGRDRTVQAAYRLLARLERREKGDEGAAMQWLTKAAEAVPDPTWLCRVCGGAHESWQPACRYCNSFASLEWQSPGVSRARETALLTQEPTLGEIAFQ